MKIDPTDHAYVLHDNERLKKVCYQYWEEIQELRAKAATVDSERECNAILTEEVEQLQNEIVLLKRMLKH